MKSVVIELSSVEPLAIRGGVDGTIRVSAVEIGDRPAVYARTNSDRRKGALARRDGESLAVAAAMALAQRVPLVLELASSGADVGEGIDALHGWGTAAAAVARCSGVVPVIGIATGPVLSGPALLLGLCDITLMTPTAVAFVSGPKMVAAFTGIHVDISELGGVSVHAAKSGLCAIEVDDPLAVVTELLSLLPANTDEEPAFVGTSDPVDRIDPDLRNVVPERVTASYDVRDVITRVVDDEAHLELWGRWAPQLVTTLARLGGRSVGILANQPKVLAGTLDIEASQKGARFVQLCDSFNLPIITLVDTPGFLPGKGLEWRGMIRHGAELVFAYGSASVPRICCILRKAFGGAYIVMDSKGLGNDVCLCWPGAQIAVMGADGAVQILNRRMAPEELIDEAAKYKAEFLTPWPAAERGFVDDVIDPALTRPALIKALEVLVTKREKMCGRKHDSSPL